MPGGQIVERVNDTEMVEEICTKLMMVHQSILNMTALQQKLYRDKCRAIAEYREGMKTEDMRLNAQLLREELQELFLQKRAILSQLEKLKPSLYSELLLFGCQQVLGEALPMPSETPMALPTSILQTHGALT
jgi:uncharacterized protein YfkK (UPF0435 family)